MNWYRLFLHLHIINFVFILASFHRHFSFCSFKECIIRRTCEKSTLLGDGFFCHEVLGEKLARKNVFSQQKSCRLRLCCTKNGRSLKKGIPAE